MACCRTLCSCSDASALNVALMQRRLSPLQRFRRRSSSGGSCKSREVESNAGAASFLPSTAIATARMMYKEALFARLLCVWLQPQYLLQRQQIIHASKLVHLLSYTNAHLQGDVRKTKRHGICPPHATAFLDVLTFSLFFSDPVCACGIVNSNAGQVGKHLSAQHLSTSMPYDKVARAFKMMAYAIWNRTWSFAPTCIRRALFELQCLSRRRATRLQHVVCYG